MKEYGILYTQENIRNLAAKLKWQTRRVIALPVDVSWKYTGKMPDGSYRFEHYGEDGIVNGLCFRKPRYPVDTVLYVKEAWRICNWNHEEGTVSIQYKGGTKQKNIFVTDPEVFEKLWIECSDDCQQDPNTTLDENGNWEWEECPTRWRSPLYMPKWAARPELKRRVTEDRVQRVQDISEEDAIAEGIITTYNKHQTPWVKWYTFVGSPHQYCFARIAFSHLWDSINAKPKPIRQKGVITHYVSYPWDDIHETRELRGKPWYVCGNPFVFAYTFEEL